MNLGDALTITQVYRRCTRYEQSERFRRNLRMRVWEVRDIKPRNAIFLGYRTLRNGSSEWEDEAGYIFEPEAHFRAMLVCFSPHENPVYTPITQED